MGKTTRRKLFIDESRLYIYTTQTAGDRTNFRAPTFGYFWHDDIIESYFSINTKKPIKRIYMYMRYFDLTSRGIQNFYTSLPARWTVLQPMWNKQTRFYESKAEYLFVPKFYHDRVSCGFLQHVKYLGKTQENNTISELGRVFYIYKSETARTNTFLDSELNWNFPDKYSTTIGLTVRGFEFTFPNLENSLKNLMEPLPGLINKNTGIEKTSSVPAQASFFAEQKAIEDAIKNYINLPVVHYINESYFLYDKSDLIKETFITALNKNILIYCSISYFN